MKKQYRLATFALSACLLMACGARETNAPENNEAEKQTENISNIDTKIDEAETSGALTESESRETPIAPKEIAIDFTGVSEFHRKELRCSPIPWKSFPRRITILLLRMNGTMHRKTFPFP